MLLKRACIAIRLRLSLLCSPHGFEAIPKRVTIRALLLYDYKVDTVFLESIVTYADYPRFVKHCVRSIIIW